MSRVSAFIICFLVGCFLVGVIFLLARNSCQIERYVFAPRRPPAGAGWENVRSGDAVYLGQFVMNKGESAENGDVGVSVVSLQPPPCPPPDSYDTDGSRARFRFYRVSDRQPLCEVEFERSTTSYELGQTCGDKIPFRGISVERINAGEGWVLFTLFNLDATDK